jgi:hypothetical protein
MSTTTRQNELTSLPAGPAFAGVGAAGGAGDFLPEREAILDARRRGFSYDEALHLLSTDAADSWALRSPDLNMTGRPRARRCSATAGAVPPPKRRAAR